MAILETAASASRPQPRVTSDLAALFASIWGTYDDGLKFIADGGLGFSPHWQAEDIMEELRLNTECATGETVSVDAKEAGSSTAASDSASSHSDGTLLLTPPSSPSAANSDHSSNGDEGNMRESTA